MLQGGSPPSPGAAASPFHPPNLGAPAVGLHEGRAKNFFRVSRALGARLWYPNTMDNNAYYLLKLRRANSLLTALEGAYESFDELQTLEARFHPSEADHDEDVRALGQDMLDLLARAEGFRDAVKALALAGRR